VASPLENLSGPGRALQKEAPDAKEFAALRRSALARLTDSAKNSNSLESRFDLAYNAAHALCWQPCVGMDTGRPIVTSSFKHCPTRSDWVRKYGACWTLPKGGFWQSHRTAASAACTRLRQQRIRG
jgi:hypothetical protein